MNIPIAIMTSSTISIIKRISEPPKNILPSIRGYKTKNKHEDTHR